MITIKDLDWSNWFSYGGNNYINFEQPVLQIMGANGAGKTSIPLVLQEVFYGKNSKGKKKTSLVNRYLTKPVLEATCNFEDAIGNKYKIYLSRKSTLKLQLFKNEEDISSHTTTNTYKTIQEIVGLDFKTFSQLVYQSSTDNLDFLTATDANRKKFLIGLFSLNKYISIQDQFKKVSSEMNTELVAVNSKISTIESWIKKHEGMDFTKKDLLDIPEIDNEDVEKLGELQVSLRTLSETNKRINQNNQNKELLTNLDTTMLYYASTFDQELKDKLLQDYTTIKTSKIENETLLKLNTQKEQKIKGLGSTCHACNQEIVEENKTRMLVEIEEEEHQLALEQEDIKNNLTTILKDINDIKVIEKKLKLKEEVSSEVIKLKNSIDDTLDNVVLNQSEIKVEIESISSKLTEIKSAIATVSKSNTEAAAHNSRINVILEQLESHRTDISDFKEVSDEFSNTIAKLEVIKKALGPSGLLSYKIDFLVKDLEQEINGYLGILSDGKFQLIFKLESEKLNIEIIDEGMSVAIEELSAGELARINAATLLAIRKLMAAISSTKINILFLDEIMGVLDEHGKEMLIEVLHNEKDLNTMLVSHEYSHPLIPKITIIKEQKISRIEEE